MAKEEKDPLNRIKQLTTPTGIYQHSRLEQVDPVHGFALEDQARALIVAQAFGENKLAKVYLDFIKAARRPDGLLYQYYFEDRGFYDNTPLNETTASQEAYGITLWALFAAGHHQDKELNQTLRQLLKCAENWTSPRAIAATLLGLTYFPKDKLIQKLTEKLCALFRRTATKDWQWFENYLVYANAILPWSLWEVATKAVIPQAKEVAEIATRFLINTCQEQGIPTPIGNEGWYFKGGNKAVYAQQPIDAAYMLCCLKSAYSLTKDIGYYKWAERWWQWFWGLNINRQVLIDSNFGCSDGLHKKGPSKNQGAESNICFLLACLAAQELGILDSNSAFEAVAKQTVVSAAP